MKIEFYGGLEIGKLELLGSGTQGRVYRIDSSRCIKVFKSRRVCEDELKTLLVGQMDVHFPRLYFAGENYIIRECIDGTPLNKYLVEHPLFHIFVTPQNELRIIDTAKALKKNEISPLDYEGFGKAGVQGTIFELC